MAFVLNDRVKETSTTTGTGTFSLAGAEVGFESFVSGIGTTNSTFYAISNDGKNEYVALYFAGGSLKTSGLLNVVTRDGRVLEFNKIVSQSLWEDPTGDLSKFHLWLADPPIIRKGGQYLIRYLNKIPSFSIVEYIWKNDKIKKANYIRSNW